MFLFVIGFLACSIAFIYYLLIKPHSYWKDRNLEYEKPHFFFGSYKPVFFRKCCAGINLKNLYDKHQYKRYVALFQFMTPALLLRDPDLVKQVIVKEFDAFPNRTAFVSKSADPITTKTIFFLEDDEWRNIRSILSPAFTRNKINSLFGIVIDCAQQFSDHFDRGSKTTIVVELKEEFSKIANDMITTTAFGLKTDSLKDPNNELFVNGKKLTNLSGFWNNIKFLLIFINPSLSKVFQVRLLNKSVAKFFTDMVRNTLKFRKENNVTRPDMMQLMMEAREGVHQNQNGENSSPIAKSSLMTDEMLAAQCMIFYFGGFDTLTTSLCFVAYELALHPDVQDKLFEEISKAFESCGGKITYEVLLNMKYLDMVVQEGLRKWPPICVLDRCPTKPFDLTLEEGKQVSIEKNVTLLISVLALQRDPAYWPNPDKFDPERFSDENKHKIIPYTYMPFGTGPRMCIGNRLALLAEKAILVNLLYKLKIVTVRKTAIPLRLCGDLPDMLAAEEYWLGLKPRKIDQ